MGGRRTAIGCCAGIAIWPERSKRTSVVRTSASIGRGELEVFEYHIARLFSHHIVRWYNGPTTLKIISTYCPTKWILQTPSKCKRVFYSTKKSNESANPIRMKRMQARSAGVHPRTRQGRVDSSGVYHFRVPWVKGLLSWRCRRALYPTTPVCCAPRLG